MKRWPLRLARYGLTQWKGLLAILILTGCGVAFEVLRPWPLKLIIDHVLENNPLPERLGWINLLPGGNSRYAWLGWLTLGTVLIFLGSWACRLAKNYLEAGVNARMVYALGADLFRHLQRLSLRFHGQQTTGDLLKRVTTDSSCVRQLMMQVLAPLVTSLLTLGSMVGVMWHLDMTLALTALLVTPLLGFCIWFFAGPMTERTYQQNVLQGQVMAVAEQTLTALPLVKAFAREDYEDQRFRERWRQGDAAYLKTIGSQLQFKVSTGSVTALGTAVVIALGGWHVLEGTLTVGSLIIFISYLGSLYSPLETLAYLSTGFAAASAGARRVFEVLEAEEEVREIPHPKKLPSRPNKQSGHVSLQDVTFGYEADRLVLKKVTLEGGPGETIALVGATGAGKSTLVSLIPRLYDPWEGKVTLDGIDVRELSISSLRAQISMVLQDPFLLPLSVADNIAYGRPQAAREEIVAAATAARADEFINQLPQGYETLIGERGAGLSGGQRQRLAIARALLKDAPVLILDEPTSALDAETEALLVQALDRLMKGRTTFIIAHRLSTIAKANRIVVLEGGRILEQGTHRELLVSSRNYRRAHELQFTGGVP